ncbi:MAG TPA: hypothetical protein VLT45_16480 [Kofleriaceae bacterium]|nr:hypothetical protein [Kofleriaceae bacterium]
MRLAIVLVLLVACGGNDSPPPCNYTEADDAGNATAGEMTGFMLDKKLQIVCGQVDGGHYDATAQTVDVDRYRVTVGGTGELVIHLDPLGDATPFTDMTVQIFDTAANPRLYAEATYDPQYDHGAFITVLPPGDYDVRVLAHAGGDISGGTLKYRLRFTPDPSLLCKALTKGGYKEAGEPNDAVSADFTKTTPFAQAAGTAEQTKQTFGNTSYLIAGTASAGTMEGEYVDNDVYDFKTGDANELTVRLDWDGMNDLDAAVLEAGTLAPAGLAVTTKAGGGEIQTFAVKPKTEYLLWVGAFMGASGDTPYNVTVCAQDFKP